MARKRKTMIEVIDGQYELDVINSHMTKVCEIMNDAELRSYGTQGGNDDE